MAFTHVWCDGFEYGTNYPSATSGTNAGISGTITNPGATPGVTTVADGTYGTYACVCALTSGGGAGVNRTISGTPGKFSTFFRMKVMTNPATNPQHIAGINLTTQGSTNGIAFGLNTSGTIRLRPNRQSATGEVTGPNVNDGAWHTVEIRANVSANPWVLDWWVDGVLQTQATRAVAADTVTNNVIGVASTPTESYTVRFDDWIMSTFTVGDERYGNVKVLGLSPGSDGTHNTAGGATFIGGDTATTPNFTNSTTTAYQLVDDMPLTVTRSTTDNISAETHVAGDYMEVKNVAASGSENPALCVTAWGQFSSPTTTANGGSATVVRTSAGTDIEITGMGNFTTGVDYSETSNFLKSVLVTNPGSWTNTELDAIRFRMGRASNSSDVNPRPTWQGLLTQVAYQVIETKTSGALDITGTGSITVVSSASVVFSGSLDLTGATSILLGSSVVTALSGGLTLTGTGTVTVAGSLYTAFSGALDVTGAGLITISNPFVTRFSGALDLTGAGSIVLGGSLTTAFSGGLDLTGAGTITIVSSDVGGDVVVESGALDLSGSGTITISNPIITVHSGALALTGAASITVGTPLITAFSGPLRLDGNGVVSVNGSLYTAFSGPLDLTGNASITITIPLMSIPFGATVNPLMGIIDDGKGVPMSVNAEKYRVHTGAGGTARKRVVLPGSWILGIMVEYITADAGTDLTVGDAVRTILDIQNSNTDTYFPVREEVVSSDGTPLGVYEPPIITDEFFIEVANGGSGKDIEVTVFYQ